MGFHHCEYCLEPIEKPHQFPNLSTGDVNLSFTNGHRYVMPDMICHYIADHQWLPPQGFIDDVMNAAPDPKIQTVNYSSFAERITDVLNGTQVGYLSGKLVTGEVPEDFLTRLVALMVLAEQFNRRLQTKGLPLARIKSAANKDRNGIVYVGRRHNEIIYIMPFRMTDDCLQGFVTDDGTFVDRREAAKIAFAAGQISKPVSDLISEDLD